MIEKIKRWPIVAWFLRTLYPYNSTCLICGLPWASCKEHCIPLDDNSGFFPVCQYCWEHCSETENRDAVLRLYKKWTLTGCRLMFSEQELLAAFEKDWEETHKKQ